MSLHREKRRKRKKKGRRRTATGDPQESTPPTDDVGDGKGCACFFACSRKKREGWQLHSKGGRKTNRFGVARRKWCVQSKPQGQSSAGGKEGRGVAPQAENTSLVGFMGFQSRSVKEVPRGGPFRFGGFNREGKKATSSASSLRGEEGAGKTR